MTSVTVGTTRHHRLLFDILTSFASRVACVAAAGSARRTDRHTICDSRSVSEKWERRLRRERLHRRNEETENERRKPKNWQDQSKMSCLLRLTSVTPSLLLVRVLRILRAPG